MANLDKIKQVLTKQIDVNELTLEEMFHDGDIIPREILGVLRTCDKRTMLKVFCRYVDAKDSLAPAKYKMPTLCKKCGKEFIAEDLSPGSFRGRTMNEKYCPICAKALQRKTNNSYNNYMNHILKPGDKLLKTDKVCGNFSFDDEIQKKINNMSYADFLTTPYWTGVKKMTYAIHGAKCCSCGTEKAKFNVHHKTYDRHGLEHHEEVAREDLIVLCEECHAKTHNIQPETPLLPNGMTQEEWDEI